MELQTLKQKQEELVVAEQQYQNAFVRHNEMMTQIKETLQRSFINNQNVKIESFNIGTLKNENEQYVYFYNLCLQSSKDAYLHLRIHSTYIEFNPIACGFVSKHSNAEYIDIINVIMDWLKQEDLICSLCCNEHIIKRHNIYYEAVNNYSHKCNEVIKAEEKIIQAKEDAKMEEFKRLLKVNHYLNFDNSNNEYYRIIKITNKKIKLQCIHLTPYLDSKYWVVETKFYTLNEIVSLLVGHNGKIIDNLKMQEIIANYK